MNKSKRIRKLVSDVSAEHNDTVRKYLIEDVGIDNECVSEDIVDDVIMVFDHYDVKLTDYQESRIITDLAGHILDRLKELLDSRCEWIIGEDGTGEEIIEKALEDLSIPDIDTTQVDVIFKKFPDNDIIALFPDLEDSQNFITSYMHIGQHGGASPDLIEDLTDAKKEEYCDLEKELIDIGYTLKVLNNEK